MYEYLEHTVLNGFSQSSSIVLLRPAMAYLLLHSQGNPADLESVLPSIRDARFIFFPINDNPDVTAVEGGWHWSLLIVSLVDKKALYYDTCQNTNYAVTYKTTKKLAEFLGYALDLVCVATPQQRNNSDCGVLVCEITAVLLKRLVAANEGDAISLGLRQEYLSPRKSRQAMMATLLELMMTD